MPKPYSIDAKLLAGLELRGMPVSEFSKVAALDGIRGASKTKLNEAFRDADPLENEVAFNCWKLWEEIETLCQNFEPFVLSLRDGEQVHQWLKAVRNNEVVSVVFVGTDGHVMAPKEEGEKS